MIKRIKDLVRENRRNQKEIINYSRELYWANRYHDSIRGHNKIENLPLNIGGWAGSYTLFYVLNRILLDFRPEKILELGLGESTKFISEFTKTKLNSSLHQVIEHDENWLRKFSKEYDISKNTNIELCSLENIQFKGFKTTVYGKLKEKIAKKYDFYLIDGPIGTLRYSRSDMIGLVDNIQPGDEFIMLIDDYGRPGEKETVEKLKDKLKRRNIKFSYKTYMGLKQVIVIGTNKFRVILNL
tara:strand:- start:542 stop:1264 length:723 start_codon:yes stop_codon:yes gene_type:complete